MWLLRLRRGGPVTAPVCSCDPRHLEVGGIDAGCPVHVRISCREPRSGSQGGGAAGA